MNNGSLTIRTVGLPVWWQADSYWKGTLRLSLKSVLGAGFGKGLLPGEAIFKFESTHRASSSSVTPVDWERRKFDFGLAWTGKNTQTEVAFSRMITDPPASPAGGPSRDQAFAVDINGSLSRKSWEISYYLSIGAQNSPVTSNRNISGGFDFALTGKRLPKLSVGVDYNRFDLQSYQLGTRSMTFGISAKLDLSQYMPLTPTGQQPYLFIKAYGDWSKSRVTGEPEDDQLDPTVMVVIGTKF